MAQQQGETTALIFKDERYTSREIWERTTSISKALIAIGVKPGDHIALWMPNNEFFIPAFLGITFIGCVMVPMNTRYRSSEASYILKNSDARLLITIDEFLDTDHIAMLTEIIGELDGLETIIVVGTSRPLPRVETLSIEDLLRIGRENDSLDLPKITSEVRPDTIAMILYTSGTTGTPKGAMLTHANICTNARIAGEVMGIGPDDRYFLPLPLFHVFGLVLGCLTPLLFGASIVLDDVFSPSKALALIEKHRSTMNFGVPAMFITELDELGKGSYDLSSLRSGIMGGAPCPIEIVKGTMERMGCDICIG